MTGGFTSPTRGRARESSTSTVTAILVDEMTGADPRPTDDLYHAIVLLDALKPGLNRMRKKSLYWARFGV